MKYELIITSLGILPYTNKKEAIQHFNYYSRLSKEMKGRIAGESVTLIDKQGHILKEHIGTLYKETE